MLLDSCFISMFFFCFCFFRKLNLTLKTSTLRSFFSLLGSLHTFYLGIIKIMHKASSKDDVCFWGSFCKFKRDICTLTCQLILLFSYFSCIQGLLWAYVIPYFLCYRLQESLPVLLIICGSIGESLASIIRRPLLSNVTYASPTWG